MYKRDGGFRGTGKECEWKKRRKLAFKAYVNYDR